MIKTVVNIKLSSGAYTLPRPMPPQTRSLARTSRVTTRSSTARAQPPQKVEAPKNVLKASQKSKTTPKSKPKPKPKVETKVAKIVEHDSEPARKRARRPGTKDRPHAGKAQNTILLMNLPVEVLTEVAQYVHPLDLVMLSRVNKFFRELFMDKRSALIWRSARENLPGLPPCPDDVSEPQYAAMLFTKRCSTCGGYAPREMNPVLMIRLCANCWEEELVDVSRVTDYSLVSSFGGHVPGQSRSWKSWCQYKEARAVKVKLNELTEAGDEDALRQWKEERRKLVEAKKKNAAPLENWLVKRERERARDRNDLKVVNKKEIESRLIKLGWEQRDFVCYDGWRRKQWDAMVLTTRTLTDKVWDNLLPRLLGHLEINHDDRLERERNRRRGTRSNAVYDWFETTRNQLPVYARATPTGESPVSAEHTASAPTYWRFDRDSDPQVLHQSFPTTSQIYEWSEYKMLIDEDVPHEQFLIDFEGKKPEFQQWITNWRLELEAHLIATLSDDIHPPNFGLSPFTMTVGTSEDVQPINTLPEDIQKLLKADAIFTTSPLHDHSAPYFYPHSFNQFAGNITKVVHHSKAREIAQALLRDLDMPDASYLGLRALGKTFLCGRCPQAVAATYSWGGIISHYLEHLRLWKDVTQRRQVRSNKNFVYVCTHDVNLETTELPLVRISTQAITPTNVHSWDHPQCLICHSVNIHVRVHPQAIVDHIRYVHLVEEPEAGTHYQSP
ncbi:hypothetical protein RSOL_348630 [Rhizoctonia solani AG-3 Rhs1AP]|uniref:F-box domain-containing protein n=1 Tax=Rhizoctonia solani AG-3 Rhs1AP TaxID=1086054 RepID=X8J901_9AGAM|nr:hypothetical protein RSOL_348630 [Rhizoctonia solani AG-3 Rhs1AP]